MLQKRSCRATVSPPVFQVLQVLLLRVESLGCICKAVRPDVCGIAAVTSSPHEY